MLCCGLLRCGRVEQQISIRPVAETAGVGEPGEGLNGEWGGWDKKSSSHMSRASKV